MFIFRRGGSIYSVTRCGTGQKYIMFHPTHLRGTLIPRLVRLGVKNFKVMDTCSTTSCTTTASTANRLAELRTVTANDGVHFTQSGYKNLANICTSCLPTLISTPKNIEEIITHFWRGFRNSRGSLRIMASLGHSMPGRSAAHGNRTAFALGRFHSRGFHPYRRH